MDIQHCSLTEPPKENKYHMVSSQLSRRICIFYVKGVGKQIWRVCGSQGIQVTFRSQRTLRTIDAKEGPTHTT